MKPELNNISVSERVLLAMLAKSLFGVDYVSDGATELEAIEESRNQAVYCLVADVAELPQDEQKKLIRTAFSAIKRNMKVLGQHGHLHELLTAAGVPYVILKGAASAYYYKKPQLRMMGDVDILVSEGDMGKVRKLLIDEGFAEARENHAFHVAYTKGSCCIEVHREFAGIPDGEIGVLIRAQLDEAIRTAECVTKANVTFMNPSPFIHGLVMLLHNQNHMVSEGIGLRHLADWAVFVNGFTDDEFVSLFSDKLQLYGLWKYAKTLSLAAHIGIGLPYREFMGDDRDCAEMLLRDIVASGNYGNKDSSRFMEGFFISNRKDGTGRRRIAQFVMSINTIVYVRWPIAKRIKLLLPFCWLYLGGRRLVRELLGKRARTNIFASYKGSVDRKELYNRLDLFIGKK